ncbi:hypothetical protein CCAX7_53310 [Capsulimonas corticalis]|uniref:Uncharacterized protein n=1 Tax=Capsulimonas corticalis TaxID=2219043 RepID=A0A402CNP8_9BACT|nr:DUF4276 family protein [Capsulimonas corticalis]BDI33280.1 hypothetical protein CCAX7_53310 [Capsulimonas corticalis]
MKFIVFVEGYTEEAILGDFLGRCMKAHFPEGKSVGIKTVRFDGWAAIHRDVAKHAKLYLNGPDREKIVAVISLIDLYGPTIYPAEKQSIVDRHAWGVKHMQEKVNDPRYRHFFAVHETEAWLLSDPAIFPPKAHDALKPLRNRPETVNNDEPPAKRLETIYRSKLNRSYDKVTDGKNLFPKLQPQPALAACPYLKQMVDEMVELATTYQTKKKT